MQRVALRSWMNKHALVFGFSEGVFAKPAVGDEFVLWEIVHASNDCRSFCPDEQLRKMVSGIEDALTEREDHLVCVEDVVSVLRCETGFHCLQPCPSEGAILFLALRMVIHDCSMGILAFSEPLLVLHIRNPVRRISEYEINFGLADELLHEICVRAVSAEKHMGAELENVARLNGDASLFGW